MTCTWYNKCKGIYSVAGDDILYIFFVYEVCTKTTLSEDVHVGSTSTTTVKEDHSTQTMSDHASTITDAATTSPFVTAAPLDALALIVNVIIWVLVAFMLGILISVYIIIMCTCCMSMRRSSIRMSACMV